MAVCAGAVVQGHMVATAGSYDAYPYVGYAYWFSHPDHLGVMGGLAGIATVRAGDARVLEIGCGDGGNVISLATLLPSGRFVGIDLSTVQIEQGRRLIAELGLTNVELHHADLTRFEIEPASFDYVIAHGVYSWVPDPVRDGLLALVRRALTPGGVAIVSYNARPGNWLFEPARQLMRFHTRRIADPNAKVREARAITGAWLDHLEATHPTGRGALARRMGSVLMGASRMLVRHDFLSESERAFLFSEVAERARQHGLAYLDNALPSAQRPELLEPEARDLLQSLTDPIRQQQYFDFFDNTRFRATLFVRDDAARGTPLRLSDLALEDRLNLEPQRPTPTPRVVLETATGEVEVTDIATRVALGLVVEAVPRAIPMRELVDLALPRLAALDDSAEAPYPPTEAGRDALLAHLEVVFRDLWRRDVVHLWRDPPALAPRRGKPQTGALQRLLARSSPQVPSLFHRFTELEPDERALLAALDGTHTLEELAGMHGPDIPERVEKLRRLRLLHN